MIRLSENLRTTRSADGAVLLDIRRGRIFRFNLTGSKILEMLRSGAEECDVVSMLVREFAADPVLAKSDTSAFLVSLRDNALLEAQQPQE